MEMDNKVGKPRDGRGELGDALRLKIPIRQFGASRQVDQATSSLLQASKLSVLLCSSSYRSTAHNLISSFVLQELFLRSIVSTVVGSSPMIDMHGNVWTHRRTPTGCQKTSDISLQLETQEIG